MAIVALTDVFPAALWPQGDMRDPLGVWGFRHIVTGDASTGSIKVTGQAPAGLRAAYIYTCYSVNIAHLAGASEGAIATKTRLLSNWPDVDDDVGVQGYATAQFAFTGEDDDFTAPDSILQRHPVGPNERFILLFDPRPTGGALDIVELEYGNNVLASTYAFEAYGYWWDRSVLQAPGGPRHPGSS